MSVRPNTSISHPYCGGKEIPLRARDGRVVATTLVDQADAAFAGRWTWRLSAEGYAVRSDSTSGKRRTVYLHRELAKAPPDMLVDHANSNRLDNRSSNLRVATPSQNCANSADRHRQSPYRGVYPHKPSGRWIAQVSERGRPRHLGIFDTPEEAAAAYDVAATVRWGDYARTNLAG